MSIDAFPACARQHGERIHSALEEGTYRPAAVWRVMIPKATGGQRPLGIHTVLDRVIQQAIAQVIGPLVEPHFSTHSYGSRPGRRARMALAEMKEAHRDGLRYAVDGDLQHWQARDLLDAHITGAVDAAHDPCRVVGRFLERVEILTVDNHCDGAYLYLRMKRENHPRAEQVLEVLVEVAVRRLLAPA